MALVSSKMIQLGTRVPSFFLPEIVSGAKVGPNDLVGGKAFVLMFLSRHCPYVQHIVPGITALTKKYLDLGFRFAGILSNDIVNYPDDHPDLMAAMAEELGWEFPFLFDQDQQLAKDCNATCTPDFFVYGKGSKLVYRGQLDESRPGNNALPTGKDIAQALDDILEGRFPDPSLQKPSIGCSIKWK